MTELSFKITHNRKKYRIYIERDVVHLFRTKKEALDYVKKYKSVLTDNLPIMLNVQFQLYLLKSQHYQFMGSWKQQKLREYITDFEDEFAQIFWNNGGDNFSYVQFNKIRVSFSIMNKLIDLFRLYGQKYKHRILLNQLNGISKVLHLCEMNYSREVKGLYVGHGYREGLVNFKPIIDETNITFQKQNIS